MPELGVQALGVPELGVPELGAVDPGDWTWATGLGRLDLGDWTWATWTCCAPSCHLHVGRLCRDVAVGQHRSAVTDELRRARSGGLECVRRPFEA